MIQAAPRHRLPNSQVPAPDEAVAELARQRLRQGPYPALRRVDCSFRAGVLVLAGVVPTFYLKQVAQTMVRDVEQVEKIDNRLVVCAD